MKVIRLGCRAVQLLSAGRFAGIARTPPPRSISPLHPTKTRSAHSHLPQHSLPLPCGMVCACLTISAVKRPLFREAPHLSTCSVYVLAGQAQKTNDSVVARKSSSTSSTNKGRSTENERSGRKVCCAMRPRCLSQSRASQGGKRLPNHQFLLVQKGEILSFQHSFGPAFSTPTGAAPSRSISTEACSAGSLTSKC